VLAIQQAQRVSEVLLDGRISGVARKIRAEVNEFREVANRKVEEEL